MTVAEKLIELRKLMAENEVDGYLLDDADNHSSEYVNDFYKDRSFISGFLGSNGKMLVTMEKSYLFTDGRYFIQAEKDLKFTEIKLMKMGEPGIPKYEELINQEMKGKRLGFDGDRFSYQLISKLDKTIKLNPKLNLIREINPVSKEHKPIIQLPMILAGESVSSKLNRIRNELHRNSLFLTRLDDIAWIYNLRGEDVKMSRVFFAFTFIDSTHAYLFIDKAMISFETRKSLESENVTLMEYGQVKTFLENLDRNTVTLPFHSTNYNYIRLIGLKNNLVDKESPTLIFKAIKNNAELKNNNSVHIQDGLAMLRLMKYVKENYETLSLDEYGIAKKAEYFRKMSDKYICPSFETIVGFKQNGAIVHYEPTEATSARITKDSFLLIDSGGQYNGGTTDITRTYQIGNVTKEEKQIYTLVLKGHLGILMTKVKSGEKGVVLDRVARKPLQEYGYDYNHGTGHGVGYMLSVHEGPNAFRKDEKGDNPIYPGMITSNEPGCYIEGKFGVRIESEVQAVLNNDAICFNPITYAPIDIDPIDRSLLTEEEKKCLNKYHATVFNALKPYCDDEELAFLTRTTREI